MKTETGRPYLGLALLTGLNLFNYLDRYVLASVVPPIKADFQLSDGEIGWLTSAFMIGYFATSPVFGYLGDRWPRRGLIVFGVTFWSAGTILSGFAHDYWTLLLCRVSRWARGSQLRGSGADLDFGSVHGGAAQ